MKKLNAFLVSALATVALNAAEANTAVIEQVIVRQQWPWSTDVKIEYKLKDVSSPVDVSVEAYNGDEKLDQTRLDKSLSGDRYGVTDVVGTIILDPVKAFGTEKVALANFKVKLSVANSSAEMQEVLYKVFDLDNTTRDVSACENVTRAALLNGKYGSVERSFDFVGTSSLSNVLIWTGITNDVKYMTRYLVLRKIPVAGQVFTVAPDGVPFQAKLTKNYWMGVFEFTQAQWAKIFSGSHKPYFTNVACKDTRPAENMAFADIRGSVNGLLWQKGVDLATAYQVDAGSPIDGLRKKFGGAFRFDLPTGVQWEIAARAGTTSRFYDGSTPSSSISTLTVLPELVPLARYKWNGGCTDGDSSGGNSTPEPAADCTTERGTNRVGSYLPNAYGLYDVLGNVNELVLDCRGNYDTEGIQVDPMGPAKAYDHRYKRGGGWLNTADAVVIDNSYLSHATSGNVKDSGFRICLTEE